MVEDLVTDTDGTTLNSNPTLGIEGSASFDANTRDVTLTSEYTLKTEQNKTESVQGVNVRQGFIYAGPRYKTINRFASTAFQSTSPLSEYYNRNTKQHQNIIWVIKRHQTKKH